MRLKARQTRFLLAVLTGWVGLRLFAFWCETPIAPIVPRMASAKPTAAPSRGRAIAPEAMPIASSNAPLRQTGSPPASGSAHQGQPVTPIASGTIILSDGVPLGPANRRTTETPPVDSSPLGASPLPRAGSRRLEGQAYLFLRPGSGRALAIGSALGGSQIAARMTIAIDPGRHLAAAARLYAPLHGRGSEAAAGLDWRPDPAVPLRFSIERRQRLDRDGRSAWSAYVAGGVYREIGKVARIDGYAQAGFVGIRHRDAFVDAAIRAEHPIKVGPVTVGVGGGLWGAAQPGARRLDAGPRAAVRLPIADHGLSLALEGRFRLAGNAHPGSGAVLTLAADL